MTWSLVVLWFAFGYAANEVRYDFPTREECFAALEAAKPCDTASVDDDGYVVACVPFGSPAVGSVVRRQPA